MYCDMRGDRGGPTVPHKLPSYHFEQKHIPAVPIDLNYTLMPQADCFEYAYYQSTSIWTPTDEKHWNYFMYFRMNFNYSISQMDNLTLTLMSTCKLIGTIALMHIHCVHIFAIGYSGFTLFGKKKQFIKHNSTGKQLHSCNPTTKAVPVARWDITNLTICCVDRQTDTVDQLNVL